MKLYSGAASNTVKKYIKNDKDMIMLQDNTNTDIWYKKPKPHSQSCTINDRSAPQIRTVPGPYGQRW